MSTRLLDKPQNAPATVSACPHHWVVETPHGATSRGVCKHCGQIRGFKNATEDYVWEQERSEDINYWGLGNPPRIFLDESVA